jgi:hypothetical protein
MSEGVNAGPALAEPQSEARDVIATCRSAWGTAHASQSEGAEVDEPALTICVASCEKLEELGYSVEGRSAELEIMLMDGESPYDGEVMVEAAAFLDFGAMVARSVERIGRGHGHSSRAGAKSVLCVGVAQAQGGQPLVEDLWWDGCALPPRPCLLWTSPAVPSYAGGDRQSSNLYDGYCCVQ